MISEEQYQYHKVHAVCGENNWARDVWLYTLAQALQDYKNFFKDPHQFKEIFNWFFNNPKNEPGSFFFICETLSIPPSMVLKKLILWSKTTEGQQWEGKDG